MLEEVAFLVHLDDHTSLTSGNCSRSVEIVPVFIVVFLKEGFQRVYDHYEEKTQLQAKVIIKKACKQYGLSIDSLVSSFFGLRVLIQYC